jgi:hypothetical protein
MFCIRAHFARYLFHLLALCACCLRRALAAGQLEVRIQEVSPISSLPAIIY